MRKVFILIGLLVIFIGVAYAKTPDGLTPAEESICSELKGSARALCNVYCEAMDCDSPSPKISSKACDKIAEKYFEKTGEDLECDRISGNSNPFTFAVISDSHIKSEIEKPIDPDWEFAKDRLEYVGWELSQLNLDFVVHTGDHVNDLYCPDYHMPLIDWDCIKRGVGHYDYINYSCCECTNNCYGTQKYTWPSVYTGTRPHCPPPILGTYADIIKKHFEVPEYWIVLGNHDDRFVDLTDQKKHVIRDKAKEAWKLVFGMEDPELDPTYLNWPAKYSYISQKSYYVIFKGRYQLFMLDSTAVKPDGCNDPGCNDEMNFGKAQLDWLKNELDFMNWPYAILFWHARVRDNEYDMEKHEILKIIGDDKYKDKIKMVFMGHGHQFKEKFWVPHPGENRAIPFYETTSTVCTFFPFDPPIPSYYHVKLNPDGFVEILNYNDIFDPSRKAEATKSCRGY